MKYSYILLVVGFLAVGCKSQKKVVTQQPTQQEDDSLMYHEDEIEQPVKVVETTPTPPPVKTEPIKPPTKKPSKNMSYAEAKQFYIDTYKDVAMREMRQYKIPASITLAQGILESGAGRSELASKSNNHFGIKCHRGWKGPRVYHDDDEAGECFRKYKNPYSSFVDHSLFLTTRGRYSKLFDLKITDYKAWARGLKKAGYATDPKYPNKLIKLIEDHQLYQYDQIALGQAYQQPIHEAEEDEAVTPIIHYTVKKGDTLYSISRKYGLKVDSIKRLNNLSSNTISVGQTLKIH